MMENVSKCCKNCKFWRQDHDWLDEGKCKVLRFFIYDNSLHYDEYDGQPVKTDANFACIYFEQKGE